MQSNVLFTGRMFSGRAGESIEKRMREVAPTLTRNSLRSGRRGPDVDVEAQRLQTADE